MVEGLEYEKSGFRNDSLIIIAIICVILLLDTKIKLYEK